MWGVKFYHFSQGFEPNHLILKLLSKSYSENVKKFRLAHKISNSHQHYLYKTFKSPTSGKISTINERVGIFIEIENSPP